MDNNRLQFLISTKELHTTATENLQWCWHANSWSAMLL